MGGSSCCCRILYFVYVLHSEKNHRYYICSSKYIKQRLARHNSGMMRFNRPYMPRQVVYTEAYETLAEARRREL